ncbi:hypothetical protein OR263_25585 [Streptomyces sp. NEAU-H22]|uniref:hypothetical protein n=1 Tax=Streptomyces sp. NEAU-H22 TaxID=2994655 RepID=UPI0022570F9F|nr:hypothetical protein [Streptomyces sp. NEAU-H22]MCX3290043.1 hypothetical protein [Streptomyces sp. NEAU-H22]
MSEQSAGRAVRAAYASSSYALTTAASRAYTNALIEHQAAALAEDPEALRAIREARAVLGIAAPEVEQLERLDPGQRRMHAVRSIA